MNTVDLSPLSAVLLQVFVPLLTAALSGAALALLRKWKLDGDDSVRQVVLKAVENGVHFGLGRMAGNIARANSVQVKNDALAAAVNYVMQQVPGSVSKLNLDTEKVRRLAEAQLSKLLNHAALITSLPPPPEGR